MQAELLQVWASRRKTVVFVTHSIMDGAGRSRGRHGSGGIVSIHGSGWKRSRSDPALLRLR
jgi:hypothetical protein